MLISGYALIFAQIIPHFPMQIIVAGTYILLLLYLVGKCPFFSAAFVSKAGLRAALLLKIACGLCFMWINQRYFYDGGDSWVYFKAGRTIFDTLSQNPLYFLELTFGPNARKPPEHLASIIENIPAWNDVRTYMVIRVNALVHLVSFHYYSVHVILGAFMGFVGLQGLYNTFTHFFPHKAKALFAVCFLVPSVLYWTSGLHKEGISLLCLGMSVYYFSNLIAKGITLRRLLPVLLWLLMLLFFRPYTFGLLVPALILWYLVKRFTLKPLLTFSLAYLLGFAVLAGLSLLSEKLNVFAIIADIRYYFVMYKIGGSEINMQLIQPNWQATLYEMPMALVNALLRPEPWGNMQAMQQLSALETLFFTLFVCFCLLFATPKKVKHACFLYACLFFSITSLILIGLTTDNLGAIVRYRSILLPLWLGFWVVVFDGVKFQKLLSK